MPYSLHIVKTNDFIRLDPTGEFNLTESRRALSGLARQCVESGINCALLDVRDMEKESLTMAEVYTLAMAFREMGFGKNHRLAVLHRYRSGERSEFFAITAQDHGWNVQAFEDYKEALDWFATEWQVK
ncbi:MAG TPA: hypothetical protein VGG44_06730 [Tepidisphaeraceae bacterium]|jgi:hypothetical protein